MFWPFKRKAPTPTMEEFVKDKPDVLCGNKVEHWTMKLNGSVCFACAARAEQEKARDRELLAEAIAQAIVRNLRK